MTGPRILTTHAVGHLRLDRFLTRDGAIVWILSDDEAGGHCGIAQGSRSEIVAFLRVAL